MKLNLKLFVLFALIIGFTSCKDDNEDEVTTSLENAEIEFNSSNPPITIPSGLTSSTDENAMQVYFYMLQANSMATFSSMFTIPEGAEKSTDPVGGRKTSNGRVENDVLNYTWSVNDQQGNSAVYVYQITDSDDLYVFELFVDINGNGSKIFMYAEESKSDLKQGKMLMYTLAPQVSSEVSDEPLMSFVWDESTNGTLTYEVWTFSGEDLITMTVLPDNSGSLIVTSGTVKTYEAAWSADGSSGTWSSYDDQGNMIDSGSWPS